MAQIASAYPTAGGLYHWGSILGNRGTGWVTAWFNLLGLVTVLGAINAGTWTFFAGAFGPALGIENTLTNQTIFLAIITGGMAAINHFGIKQIGRDTSELQSQMRISYADFCLKKKKKNNHINYKHIKT